MAFLLGRAKSKEQRAKLKTERRKVKDERREFREFREFKEFRENHFLDSFSNNWIFRV